MLSPLTAAALAVGTFAVVVAGATLTGNFDWTMPTLAEAVADEGAATEGAVVETASGVVAFDTSLIKGSTTMAEVVDVSGIPAEVFTDVYGVPRLAQVRQLKDLKEEYGCSPGELRAFVEAYTADPSVADTWVVGEFEESEEH